MKFSVKSFLVALALLLGGTMMPSAGEAQSFYGGGLVQVRDGHRDYRGSRFDRRDHRRAFYRDRYHGGSRHYRGSRFDRRERYYGGRRHDRDRRYFNRRHHGNGSSVVIRLR